MYIIFIYIYIFFSYSCLISAPLISIFYILLVVFYNMANFVNQQDFNEMLIWVTAIIMLRKPERDLAYGDEAFWHFIETVLTGKNEHKACIHFLKSEAALLA